MSEYLSKSCTAFQDDRILHSGPLLEVALAVKAANEQHSTSRLLVFDDATGHVIDLDLRGTNADVIERLSQPQQEYAGRYESLSGPEAPSSGAGPADPNGRGRPKLGVVAREITLLPRQWEWLSSQRGGASAVIRRLVDDARRSGEALQIRRSAQEAAYKFMHGIAGDLAGYEEATRALFADDRPRLEKHISGWPADIRHHVIRLGYGPQ